MKEVVHAWLPHTQEAFYGFMFCSALLFGVVATIVSYVTENCFQPWHTIQQAGSGTTFPVFVLMPFFPYDQDLMQALVASWITVAMAGMLGMGVTIYALFFTNERRSGGDFRYGWRR